MNGHKLKKILFSLLYLAPFVMIFLLFYPINNFGVRISILVCVGISWYLLVDLCIKWNWVVWVLIGAPIIFILGNIFMPKDIDTVELKQNYLKNLRSYKDVKYVWGGESSFGIDCSGLPRAAMRMAYLDTSARHLPIAFQNWWFDASAKAMSEGYRNYLKPLDVSGNVVNVRENELQAGDLAITQDGVHVMSYLGNGEWIHADPKTMRVGIEKSKSSKNAWFRRPVKFYRWQVFFE